MKLKKLIVCSCLYATLLLMLAASTLMSIQCIICDYDNFGVDLSFIAIQIVVCITGYVSINSLIQYYKTEETVKIEEEPEHRLIEN